MDPSLLKEREAFKARALAVPVVEKRKMKDVPKSKPAKKPKPAPKEAPSFNYKTATGSSQYKFAVLAKIVKYMKTRHQKGANHALSLEEVLEETNQHDIGAQMKHWLDSEALRSNPKIEVVDGEGYKFRPKLSIRGREGLRRLLEKHDLKGLGGILLDDVEESLPDAHKAIKALGDQIIQVVRPNDKKVVLFCNDKSTALTVDEELQKLWRGVGVEGVDERKMEEYLEKQGFTSMTNTSIKTAAQLKKNAKKLKKKGKFLKAKDNEHLQDILQDYSKESK